MARNDSFDHSDDQRRASADPRINPEHDPNAYRHVGDEHGRVAPLDDLDDFKVADNEPDPRGWKVRSSDNKTVGKVKNLIADSGAMKVRYLEIDLDKKELNLDDDRRVLAPIGAARLNDDDDVVVIDRPSTDFAALPEYKKDKWNRNYENELRSAWSRGGTTRSTSTTAGSDADFYAHEHFNDRNFFGNRRTGRENEAYIARSGSEMGRRNPESRR
jgi:hypothetical protein